MSQHDQRKFVMSQQSSPCSQADLTATAGQAQ